MGSALSSTSGEIDARSVGLRNSWPRTSVSASGERSSGARALVDASVQQGLRGAGVPNREIYEDLLFRVEQLEHRVRLLEDRPVTPSAAPTTPEAEPAPPVPPASGVDVTSQPPGEEPDTPPGPRPGE